VHKDCKNILAETRALGLRLPLAERITELYSALAEHGGADYDHTAVLLELERMNAGKRVSDKPDRLPN
jgi:2-hydroxy-3-oxopropionate reductase